MIPQAPKRGPHASFHPHPSVPRLGIPRLLPGEESSYWAHGTNESRRRECKPREVASILVPTSRDAGGSSTRKRAYNQRLTRLA